MRVFVLTFIACLTLTYSASAESCNTLLGSNPKVSDIQRIFSCLNSRIDDLEAAKGVASEVQASTKKGPAWLGIQTKDITRDMASAIGLSGTDGAFVRSVVKGSPAEKSGFKSRDIITAIKGAKVKSTRDFSRKMDAFRANTTVKFTIVRNGHKKQLNVRLGSKPIIECDGQKTRFFLCQSSL